MNSRPFFVGLSVMVGVFLAGSAVEAAQLTGKAVFQGQSPAADVIQADADPHCKLLHPAGIVPDQVIVNTNGTLKNVFIYVKSGVQGVFPTPKEAVVFDQKGCQYSPKVFGIQVNQPLEILNSDDTLHNVHALPANSPQFNLGMPVKGMKLKKMFSKPEVMIKIKCEVHPWMAAYAGVLDHPFFGVTGDDGSYTIKDLPPGEYEIEAWHEKYGTQTQKVTVAAEGQTADFQFTAAP